MEQTQLAQIALQLMARVELKGSEVGHFSAVVNWLNGMAQAEPPKKPVEAPAETEVKKGK